MTTFRTARRARLLEDHLNADESMARLAAHATHLQKLQQSLGKCVPSMLAPNCRVANFKLDVVIIHAENGAVAAKLRQMAPSLVSAFRSAGEQVAEVRIKVQPADIAQQPRPLHQAAILGDAGRTSVSRLSESLPDGPLKDALNKLIHHGRTR